MEIGVDELVFDVLSEDERVLLEHLFSEKELLAMLKDFKREKVTKPDGFTMVFLKHCWEVVKDDFMAMLIKSLNALCGINT